MAPPSWLRSVAATSKRFVAWLADLATRRAEFGRGKHALLAVVLLQIVKAEDHQPAGEVLQEHFAIKLRVRCRLRRRWTVNVNRPARGLRTSCESMARALGDRFRAAALAAVAKPSAACHWPPRELAGSFADRHARGRRRAGSDRESAKPATSWRACSVPCGTKRRAALEIGVAQSAARRRAASGQRRRRRARARRGRAACPAASTAARPC